MSKARKAVLKKVGKLGTLVRDLELVVVFSRKKDVCDRAREMRTTS